MALINNDFSPESPLAKFGKQRYVHDLEFKFDAVDIDLPGGRSRAARLRLYRPHR